MTPKQHHQAHPLSPPEAPQRVFLANAYGMVGQGKTQSEANADLWEKIRQAREA